MNRISLSLDAATYSLIKNKTNKSKYISELIMQDAYATHKDALAERVAAQLLSNELFITEVTQRVKTVGRGTVVDWGA